MVHGFGEVAVSTTVEKVDDRADDDEKAVWLYAPRMDSCGDGSERRRR